VALGDVHLHQLVSDLVPVEGSELTLRTEVPLAVDDCLPHLRQPLARVRHHHFVEILDELGFRLDAVEVECGVVDHVYVHTRQDFEQFLRVFVDVGAEFLARVGQFGGVLPGRREVLLPEDEVLVFEQGPVPVAVALEAAGPALVPHGALLARLQSVQPRSVGLHRVPFGGVRLPPRDTRQCHLPAVLLCDREPALDGNYALASGPEPPLDAG